VTPPTPPTLATSSVVSATVVAAVVSAAVAGLIQLVTLFRYLPYRLKVEQSYEQRKALRELIGSFHGRLLEEAVDWHWRMHTIYEQIDAGVEPLKDSTGATWAAYKLVRLATVAQQFTWDAFYIDQRIALQSDRDFVAFVKLLQSTMAGHSLLWDPTQQLPRSRFDESVPGDVMKVVCEAMLTHERVASGLLSLRESERRLRTDQDMECVVRFVEGVGIDDAGFRWDRLVATHLVAAAFVNAYGYPFQKISAAQLQAIAGRINHDLVRQNLAADVQRFGLADKDGAVELSEILRN
jgi:hypothetical protein